MTNFPRMMVLLNDYKNNSTMYDFDEINLMLNTLADDHVVEPIDDPNVACDFWDWADVIGIVDEYCPVDPFWVEVN